LSVRGERCQAIEPYLSLAVALMIDPEADLGEPPEHAEEPKAESPSPAPAPPAVVAKEALPSEPGAPLAPVAARVSGRGRRVVYVYPALSASSEPQRRSSIALSQLTQRLFGQRLLEREIYTVVQPPPLFDSALQAENFRRDALDAAPPKAFTAPNVLAPGAEYLLQPLIESLTVQDGLDYSRGSQLPLVTVTLRMSLTGIDYVRREELEALTVTETVSVEGNRHDAGAVGFAVRLAAGKTVESLVSALRREAAFRIRPRWQPESTGAVLGSLRGVESGDRFQFEDESGARSGWAVVREVEGKRAKLQVWKSGSGERLVDVGKKPQGTFEVSLRRAQRLGYGEASDAERARALASSRSTRALGSVSEYGLDWRYYLEATDGAGLRTFAASNFNVLKSDGNLAFGIATQLGAGYELPALPAVGLSLLPFAAMGPMFIQGKLGKSDAQNVPLESLLGLTASVGAHLELYRLFGAVSLSASAQFEYVLPLYSQTPREQYLDDSYPSLHAFVLQLGGVIRASDYPD
jgi:hypothetical protein